eukprot:181643-Pelagomonas_calceolata.AAC.1
MACITGGHVIVALGFVCVFFAHWAPAKLAAWVLCQPPGYVRNVGHFQPFIEEDGVPLDFVLALLDIVWESLVLSQVLPIQNALDHVFHSQVAVSVFGVVDVWTGLALKLRAHSVQYAYKL